MIKTLIQHGDSYALVFDASMMELLRMAPNTPLEVRVNDGVLQVKPVATLRFEVNKELIRERKLVHTRRVKKLMEELDLKSMPSEEAVQKQEELRQLIREEVYSDPAPLVMYERGVVFEQVVDEIFGYGPLTPALRDPTLKSVAIEANGTITGDGKSLPLQFDDESHITEIVQLLAMGKRKGAGKYIAFALPVKGFVKVAKKWVPN